MPRIAEIKEIDGDIWVRIPKPMFSEENSVTLYTAGELHHLKLQVYDSCIASLRDLKQNS